MKKPKKDFLQMLSPSSGSQEQPAAQSKPDESKPLVNKLPDPPAPPRQEFANFSSRISLANDTMLNRVKHWVPGAVKQDIFNEAMRRYLESFPESQHPTPKELGQ